VFSLDYKGKEMKSLYLEIFSPNKKDVSCLYPPFFYVVPNIEESAGK
jgi:hypothetical protein